MRAGASAPVLLCLRRPGGGVGRGRLAAFGWLAALGLGCGSPTVPRQPTPATRSSAEAGPAPAASERDEPGWLRGQLHLHSDASGDSHTPPADVARWYAAHDYDFIVFTDHNRITEVEAPPGLLVFRGIELTQNLDTCDPPPQPGLACLLHVNGLFVGTNTEDIGALPSPTEPDRLELYGHAMRVTETLGGVAMLDHPNVHYAADTELLVALAHRGLTMFEVANEAVDSNNAGDASHPSTEAMWDGALTSGARLWGVATDDAHHYGDAEAVRARGEVAHVGDRGWVMVRAEPDEVSIRSALERGDFYASNGVELTEVRVDGSTLEVVAAESVRPHHFVFIGPDGEVLHEQRGQRASFTVAPEYVGYVRVRVTDRGGRRAWTQPVWFGDASAPP